MSITNITPQELKLQAEVFNLTGELSAVRSFLLQERLEVRQLKAKSEMDYAMLAGVNALIAGLKREVAELIEAATREECAKVVEQDLYPTEDTEYIRQYNYSIKVLAEKIRSGT